MVVAVRTWRSLPLAVRSLGTAQNLGWVQVMGPIERIAQYKQIETSPHFNLTGNRRKIGVGDPRLEDRVADNTAKFEITESESLLFGRDFGVGTDIETGPNGNLYVVSLDHGAVYEIFRR
jgi:hypothetical protein